MRTATTVYYPEGCNMLLTATAAYRYQIRLKYKPVKHYDNNQKAKIVTTEQLMRKMLAAMVCSACLQLLSSLSRQGTSTVAILNRNNTHLWYVSSLSAQLLAVFRTAMVLNGSSLNLNTDSDPGVFLTMLDIVNYLFYNC